MPPKHMTIEALNVEVENIKENEKNCRTAMSSAVQELGKESQAAVKELSKELRDSIDKLTETLARDRRETDIKLNARPSWAILVIITFLSSAVVGLLVRTV